MKVNMVTTWGKKGGIASYSSFLHEHLIEFVDVSIISIDKLRKNPFYYNQIADKSAEETDLIHVQHGFELFGKLFFSGVYAPVFYSKISDYPVVTTMHEVKDLQKIEHYSHIKGKVGKFLLRKVTRPVLESSNLVLVHTASDKEILRGLNGSAKVRVLPHGIVRREVRGKEKSKKELGLEGKKVVTIFGFASERKGHDRLVSKFDKIEGDAVLLIAGEVRSSSYKGKLKKIAEDIEVEERIKFLGYIPSEKLSTVFGASDLLVFPHRHITQSGAVSMSIGYGKPVLVSNAFRIDDYPVESFDSDKDMIQKINSLLRNKKRRKGLIKKAKKYREENSWRKVAERTRKIYEGVLSP
ncbi:hypothetical protein AKJ38_01765 [candidate division MSBL1 archaeon SCGC-AAA259I14]|uniref:Uncharacterized protein n=1 Tax=candidate division MSBL1 archaeon SCGC-AAA259I14 TaxID=1698268 RepID=A0A133USI9_9EURY|nr:hypothetical protein AKJ38_01765 [candidate division MSBL1 archaeon SCGC-AAA259I14]